MKLQLPLTSEVDKALVTMTYIYFSDFWKIYSKQASYNIIKNSSNIIDEFILVTINY